MSVYLNLHEKTLDDTRKKAKKDEIESYGEDTGNLLYANLEFIHSSDIQFNESDNSLTFTGDLFLDGQNFGYMSFKTTLDFDTIIEIIEAYRKKLGKLKTVLEATK